MFGEEIIKSVVDVAGKFIPDANKKAEFEAEYRAALLNAEAQLALAQTEVNKTEAGSEDKFSRRWRPFIGYVCGVAFAYHFVLQPFFAFILAAFDMPIMLPAFDIESLNTVLMGLLGLGGLRSLERIKAK